MAIPAIEVVKTRAKMVGPRWCAYRILSLVRLNYEVHTPIIEDNNVYCINREKIMNCLFKAPCQYCLDYVLLPDLQVHQTKVLFRVAEPEPEPVFLAEAGAEKITKFRLRLRL